MGKYLYDPGDGRFKHCWQDDKAGFTMERGEVVGKCSGKIDSQKAQSLLDDGFEWRDEPGMSGPPDLIYNVFEGVPYVAVPTNPGISFHGYPVNRRPTEPILSLLRKRAEAQGHKSTFKAWEKEHLQ